MNIPRLNTVFPINSVVFDLQNEPLVEINTFLCDNYYYRCNINGSINKCYLRESVATKLKTAETYLPESYKFKIYDGWRPFQVQKSLYDDYRAKIVNSIPGLEEDEINELTKLFVSPPVWDKKLGPVHSTGGAVDLK